MSVLPTVPDPDVRRLIDEGFEVEITHVHIVVHSIPYVNAKGELHHGILAASYTGTGKPGISANPKDHTMYFQGEMPHHASSGQPMDTVVNGAQNRQLFSGLMVQYYLSNKRNNVKPSNYYDLITHYHSLFRAEAQIVDANADGRTCVTRPNRDTMSPFKYPDTASSRAGITPIAEIFLGMKIAIIGLGGTGSYILDLVVKTTVGQIHLYDGDYFDSHNAYRAPGAASLEEVNLRENKTDYFARKYGEFRTGIVSNPVNIDACNLEDLKDFDFVFIAIDSGSSRALISKYLSENQAPFIDVGMGMNLTGDDPYNQSLAGMCRVTLSTPAKCDHLASCLDVADDVDGDDLYQSNIQIADLNSINAVLAVIKWKQYVGASDDQSQAHNLRMSMSLLSLQRSEEMEDS